MKVKVGIIGGTGFSDPDVLENRKEKVVNTPYGEPSDVLKCGTIGGVECVVLSRHGRGHNTGPTHINFRANIWALKEEGCTHVIVTTACGSLKEEVAPGHFVILDQFIDRTTKREQSFYDHKPGHWEGVCHIPLAEPFSPALGKILAEACISRNRSFHQTGTVVTIEGPRFSCRAESNLYRSWNADVINMTTVPEVVLAKEAGLLYGALAVVTDYDCWRVGEEAVSQEAVVAAFREHASAAKQVIIDAVQLISKYGDWSALVREATDLAKNAVM